jgi:hypothetical protein
LADETPTAPARSARKAPAGRSVDQGGGRPDRVQGECSLTLGWLFEAASLTDDRQRQLPPHEGNTMNPYLIRQMAQARQADLLARRRSPAVPGRQHARRSSGASSSLSRASPPGPATAPRVSVRHRPPAVRENRPSGEPLIGLGEGRLGRRQTRVASARVGARRNPSRDSTFDGLPMRTRAKRAVAGGRVYSASRVCGKFGGSRSGFSETARKSPGRSDGRICQRGSYPHPR